MPIQHHLTGINLDLERKYADRAPDRRAAQSAGVFRWQMVNCPRMQQALLKNPRARQLTVSRQVTRQEQ
jgi:hypothetical protein